MAEEAWPSSVIYQLPMSTAHKILYLSCSTSISLSNIIVNAFLIHALRKLNKLNSVSFVFILLLSIADIGVGLIQLPIQLTPLLDQPKHPDAITLTAQFFVYFINQLSGCMIIIITIDRFIHMQYLVRYNMYMTKTRAILLVCTNIAGNFTTSILLTASSIYGFYKKWNVIMVPCYVFGFVIIIIIYYKTYCSILKRTAALNLARNHHPATARRVRKPNIEFAKSTVYMLTFLMLFYLPSILMTFIRSVLPKYKAHSNTVRYALLWSYVVAYVNSTGNAVIFIAHNSELKRFFLSFLKHQTVNELIQENQSNASTSRVFNIIGYQETRKSTLTGIQIKCIPCN